MTGFFDVLIFLFGLIIGSFLNVVIYRYNTGFSINGRSKCLACGGQLRWFELIPVCSYLVQGGRCRRCKSWVSWQYPVVELISALAFVAIWQLQASLLFTVLYWAIFSLLIVILVYDLRHLIIPDGLVFLFIILALAVTALSGERGIIIDHLLAGLGLAGAFALLWLISRGRWMGFGDAKLALGVGFLLGSTGGLSAIVTAFWTGAVVGVGLIALSRLLSRKKRVSMNSELPFAPFIIIGLVLVFFFHLNVLHF